jgi:hypothetical protein
MTLLRLAVLSALLTSCSVITGVPLEAETVTAACGTCVFKRTEGQGCYWAVEWEGVYYPVNGHTPADHDAHGPEGMCTMPRKAIVSGKLRSGQLFADRFELLPVDPAQVPASPPVHDHPH